MMPNPVRRIAVRRPRVVATLLVSALAALACESDSVFEGEPTVAPPVVEFDEDATATRAIHGGQLAIGLTATDPFVGIDSVVVRYSGPLQGGFTRRYPNAPEQVRIDTVLAVPFGTQGTLVIEAFALNRFLAATDRDTALVQIVREDTIRPGVTLPQISLPTRVERFDTLRIRVLARDDQFGSGVQTVGVLVEDLDFPTAGAALFTRTVAATDSVDVLIDVPVGLLPGPSTARVRNLRVTAFAIDQAGNCIAIGAAGTLAGCTALPGGGVDISNVVGASATTEVTATRSSAVAALSGAGVGDMVVNPATGLLYISNTANNSVDAFSWTTATVTRTTRAFVGSAPLGMTMDISGQSLIVANSGGTSLSFVNIAGGVLQETSRYETPDAVLHQLIPGPDTTIILTEHTGISDRPQFVAQDAAGVVFYSTVPTSKAPTGAVRKVEQYPGASAPESSILLPTQVVSGNRMGPFVDPLECYSDPDAVGFRANVLPCVIANVDSIKIVYENPFLGTTFDVWDHVAGRPDLRIYIRSTNLYEIAQTFRDAGSDIFIYKGTWDFTEWLSAGPSTFVTSSGDRTTVNVAEEERGRVWNWNATTNPIPFHSRLISNFVNIEDYESNTSSSITGASANQNGLLLATRSSTQVFFFTNPLRLLGLYDAADIAGGTGIAVHPDAQGGTTSSGNMNWAAVGSAEAEVILVDTRHFRRVGRIALLEPVGGPLRVARRIGSDPADVVGHILGVTQSGRVFEVPVRSSDINP